jgi:DNA-binding NarL/FixJ family response regulator
LGISTVMQEKIDIIIAEDHERFRKSILQELEAHSIFPLAEASNGLELIEHLESITPDVILLDLEMPEMDGNTAFKNITEKYPGIKIIILSQHDEQGMIENYVQRGAKGYLPKQFVASNVNILAEGIRTVHGNGTFYYAYDPSARFKYSRREIEIIPLLYDCKTSKEIGSKLGLPEKRINKVRDRLYKKTNSRNSTEFVKYCVQKGLKFLGK